MSKIKISLNDNCKEYELENVDFVEEIILSSKNNTNIYIKPNKERELTRTESNILEQIAQLSSVMLASGIDNPDTLFVLIPEIIKEEKERKERHEILMEMMKKVGE